MSIHSSQLDSSWTKLRMEMKEKRRHVFAVLRVGGKVVVTTLRSRGSGEVSAVHLIRRQMHLNESQFQSLIACPLDLPRYLGILKSKKVIESEEDPIAVQIAHLRPKKKISKRKSKQ